MHGGESVGGSMLKETDLGGACGGSNPSGDGHDVVVPTRPHHLSLIHSGRSIVVQKRIFIALIETEL